MDKTHSKVHRLISDLSDHELKELKVDYGLKLKGYDVIALLTKTEWEYICMSRPN